jgi:hypothetical protein
MEPGTGYRRDPFRGTGRSFPGERPDDGALHAVCGTTAAQRWTWRYCCRKPEPDDLAATERGDWTKR